MVVEEVLLVSVLGYLSFRYLGLDGGTVALALVVFIVTLEIFVQHPMRLTKFYKITRCKQGVELRHAPWSVLYRADRSVFMQQREEAIAKLVNYLKDEKINAKQWVISRSSWIPYEQEGWLIEQYTPKVLERINCLALYLCNLNSWSNENAFDRIRSIMNKPYTRARIDVGVLVHRVRSVR